LLQQAGVAVTADTVLTVPRALRRGGKGGDEAASIASAVDLLHLISRHSDVDNLAGLSLLDVGCGCKLVQALLRDRLPIGRYVGVDVFPELVRFLQSEVRDERFDFHLLDTHNAMYNPQGEPLSAATALPERSGSFDIICLFSVFTHLAPHDYVAMLQLLRPYIKPGGLLIFSLFLHETTPGGHGFIDGVARAMATNGTVLAESLIEAARQGPPDFLDWDPQRPLFRAIYSRRHALALIEDTGWEVESVNDPEENIQHYIVCRPASATAT
jgi:SAM-dependent methyltransferase